MRAGLLVVTLSSLLSLDCGSPSPPGAQSANAATTPETRVEVDSVRYETAVPRAQAQVSGALARHVKARFEGRPGAPVRDPRLDQIAELIVANAGDELRAPDAATLDSLCRAFGLVEPVPQVSLAAAGSELRVAELLDEKLGSSLKGRRPTHYGVATHDLPGGVAGALVLSSRWIELEPIARRASRPSSLRLEGRLLGGHTTPSIAITDPAGAVSHPAIALEGTNLKHTVRLDEEGVYRVEVLAQGTQGVTVVANFPVWVDRVPPTPILGSGSKGISSDPAAVRERLIALTAAERAERGLPALTVMSSLDTVALGHSQEMLREGYVGHDSKLTGTPWKRVETAGISAAAVLENLGRGYSAEEIHTGLMQSPGHRANLLSPTARELGVGVVAEAEGSRDAFLATMLFTQLARAIDPLTARRQLFAKVQALRSEARLGKVRDERGLRAAAQAAAERFFTTRLSQQELLNRTLRANPKLPEGARGLGAGMLVVRSLEQVEEIKAAMRPDLRWLGIGVAQGDRKDTGKNTIAIVLLYATP